MINISDITVMDIGGKTRLELNSVEQAYFKYKKMIINYLETKINVKIALDMYKIILHESALLL